MASRSIPFLLPRHSPLPIGFGALSADQSSAPYRLTLLLRLPTRACGVDRSSNEAQASRQASLTAKLQESVEPAAGAHHFLTRSIWIRYSSPTSPPTISSAADSEHPIRVGMTTLLGGMPRITPSNAGERLSDSTESPHFPVQAGDYQLLYCPH